MLCVILFLRARGVADTIVLLVHTAFGAKDAKGDSKPPMYKLGAHSGTHARLACPSAIAEDGE